MDVIFILKIRYIIWNLFGFDKNNLIWPCRNSIKKWVDLAVKGNPCMDKHKVAMELP